MTLKDLLRRIAPPLVVYRESLIPAIASEFACSTRTVVRKMKEGFRNHFLAASKNGRLSLTQKGIAFIEGEPLFSDVSSSPFEEPPHKGTLINRITSWGGGNYNAATAMAKSCRQPSSCDCDTPLYKGVVCRRHAGPEIEQANEASQLAKPRPKKLPGGRWVMVTAAYRPFWPIMAKMPTLSHWPDRNLPFDYSRSDVIRYTMQHCGVGFAVALRVFDSARNQKVVLFDAASKTWVGVKGGFQ